MNAKIINISLDLLAKVLHMPAGIKIIGVNKELSQPRLVELLVESPDLPEVREYERIPQADLILQLGYCKACNDTHIVKSEITD